MLLLNSFQTQGQNNSDEIVIAKRDSLFSKALNEKRGLFIHIPSEFKLDSTGPSESKLDSPRIKYPVIYVLDPEENFLSIVSMMDRISLEEMCPQMIVVGVRSPERVRDMFPLDEEDKFHQFLENELIPYIDKKYPTYPYRVLFGHSITGLRTVHTAINHPDLFNAYITIDPSLCHEYCRWHIKYKEQIDNFELGNDRMFLAMAHTMGDKDTAEVRKDTSGLATHMNSMMNLSENMLKKNNEKENFTWKYYPEYSHRNVTLQATLDGLESIFSWFKNERLNIVYSEDSTPEESFTIYNTHFKKVSEELGYKYLPPERKVISLAWYLHHSKQQSEKALLFAEMHVKNYPAGEYSEHSKKLLKEIRSVLKLKKKK